MRGASPRALASSQVSQWFGRRTITAPAYGGTVTVQSMARAAQSGAGNTTCSVDHGTAQAGDLIVVLATHIIGSASTSLTPSATGLTFSQSYYTGAGTSAAGVWVASVPDSTVRTVTLTVNNTGTAGFGMFVYVVRGASASAPVNAATSAATSSSWTHTVPSFTVPAGGAALAAVQTQDDNSLSTSSTGWTAVASAANIGTLSAHLGSYRTRVTASEDMVVSAGANGPDIGLYVYAAIAPS